MATASTNSPLLDIALTAQVFYPYRNIGSTNWLPRTIIQVDFRLLKPAGRLV